MFWRMLVIKQLLVPIDFHSMSPQLWKSIETNNCLVLQNSSKYGWENDNKNFHFGVNYSFKEERS